MDRTQWVNSSGTTVGYPLYDGHGNMVATLAKSGSSFSLGDLRAYDAWGVIRQGATSGDPKGRYCANLGHVEDDESGLTYMRARYYEAASGRFLSQDPAMYGENWYSYCASDPVNRVDPDGKKVLSMIFGSLFIAAAIACTGIAIAAAFCGDVVKSIYAAKLAVYTFGVGFGIFSSDGGLQLAFDIFLSSKVGKVLDAWLTQACTAVGAGSRTLAAKAVGAAFMYALACWAFLIGCDYIEGAADAIVGWTDK